LISLGHAADAGTRQATPYTDRETTPHWPPTALA
jgi:hypothetical protein